MAHRVDTLTMMLDESVQGKEEGGRSESEMRASPHNLDENDYLIVRVSPSSGVVRSDIRLNLWRKLSIIPRP